MKFIPYGRHTIDKADIRAVTATLNSGWITQGPKIREFEDVLCKYTGAKYAVAVSSGTAALHIAALAAGIDKGDEVITSPITFAASANCVLYAGGRPVFADIEPDTANIDPKEIEKKITRKTKVIIPVHFAGHPCEMEEIGRIAKKHKLLVIEDTAHALGAKYKGQKIGNCKFSDMAILSFHPVKHITTGEGGAVLTNRKDIYEKLLMLRTHGITKDRKKFNSFDSEIDGDWYYEMQELGFNYRITDFQCALGLSQLIKLDKFVEKRRKLVDIYRRELEDFEEVVLPTEKEEAKSSWHLFYIRVKNAETRKYLFEELKKNGIGAQVHYIPVYWHPYYQKLGYKKGLCTKAEKFYFGEITVPLFPLMTEEDVLRVSDIIKKTFFKI